MKDYTYIAVTKAGVRLKGERKAASPVEVVEFLHSQNMVVISVQEKLGFNLTRFADIQVGGVPLKEKMIITKQLSTMLGAGVPLIQALEVIVEQTKNSVLKAEFEGVYKSVEGGMSLAKAFKKTTKLFDELQINLLLAGEKSGNLVEILRQLTVDLEKRSTLFGKIRGAMIYPAIVFALIVGVIVFMLIFLIPAVQGLYDDLGIEELPAITLSIVNASKFFTNPVGALLVIVFIISSIIGFRTYYKSDGGRATIDKLFLRLPIFGKINEYTNIVQLTRLLSMLIKSGIPIIDALKTVSLALPNIHYKKALIQAAYDVSKGGTLQTSFKKSEIMPTILLKMIAVGENTGTLEQMLADMSAFYEAELNEITDNLTKLMEPFILVVFGFIVAFLAVAIYLPIYSISANRI